MRRPLRSKASLRARGRGLRVARELVPELDEHLAALSVLFHQYLKHAWVSPAEADSYGALAHRHHEEVLMNMHEVARATLALGGVPLGGPLEHVNYSYLEHEDEGVFDLAAMIDHDARHEDALGRRLAVTLEAATELRAAAAERVLADLILESGARRERLRSHERAGG